MDVLLISDYGDIYRLVSEVLQIQQETRDHMSNLVDIMKNMVEVQKDMVGVLREVVLEIRSGKRHLGRLMRH